MTLMLAVASFVSVFVSMGLLFTAFKRDDPKLAVWSIAVFALAVYLVVASVVAGTGGL